MNKVFAVVLICLLATGCAREETTECTRLPEENQCQGSRNNPMVTVKRIQMDVAPRNVCASPGSTLKFNLTPANQYEPGDTEIVPKNPDHTWLSGDNSGDKNEIEIPVPGDLSYGDYDYTVQFSDGTCIDPRVDVGHVALMEEPVEMPEQEMPEASELEEVQQ